MFTHPYPDPVAIQIANVSVHWYGLLYLFGFTCALLLGYKFIKKPNFSALHHLEVSDIIVTCAIGVILGGRLGYILFYKLSYYLSHPLEIFHVWQGGMSFHGGLLGVAAALFWIAKFKGDKQSPATTRQTLVTLFDFVAVLTPPGLGLGRLGNFINGELPGRVITSELPWAMVYSKIDDLPRHPSALYQLAVEGVVLTVVMLFLATRRHRHAGWLSGGFLIAYGVGRFATEFFREPDAHLGLLVFNLSMGQWLCVPMILLGLVLVKWQGVAGNPTPPPFIDKDDGSAPSK